MMNAQMQFEGENFDSSTELFIFGFCSHVSEAINRVLLPFRLLSIIQNAINQELWACTSINRVGWTFSGVAKCRECFSGNWWGGGLDAQSQKGLVTKVWVWISRISLKRRGLWANFNLSHIPASQTDSKPATHARSFSAIQPRPFPFPVLLKNSIIYYPSERNHWYATFNV